MAPLAATTFNRAIKALGAARWQAGQTDAARDDFKQGAERELARVVPTRAIDDAISPIQGAARDALDAARP